MQVAIISGGTLVTTSRVREVLEHAQLRVCADSGATTLLELGYVPDVIIGDMDSTPPQVIADLQARGLPTHVFEARKEQTDTELALDYALQHGATGITILGALGGARFDHALGNVFLLARRDLAGCATCLLDGSCQVQIARQGSPVELVGTPGDYVSLIPLDTQVTGVTTQGLEYALDHATLQRGPALGISNELTGVQASINVQSGLLIVVHQFMKG